MSDENVSSIVDLAVMVGEVKRDTQAILQHAEETKTILADHERRIASFEGYRRMFKAIGGLFIAAFAYIKEFAK